MADPVVVITGASSGIGEKLAEVCVTRGAYVVLAARSLDKLAAIATRLGHRAHAVQVDVTKRADNARLRDVVLAVRADEAGHRDVNHGFADELRPM